MGARKEKDIVFGKALIFVIRAIQRGYIKDDEELDKLIADIDRVLKDTNE
jgi:uncharacterized protein with ParB-like and HNH nuclease domain